MHNDKVVHLNDLLLDSELRLTEPQTDEGSDLVPTPSISESKDTTTEPITQEIEQENLQPTPQSTAEEQVEVSAVENEDADRIDYNERFVRALLNRAVNIDGLKRLIQNQTGESSDPEHNAILSAAGEGVASKFCCSKV